MKLRKKTFMILFCILCFGSFTLGETVFANGETFEIGVETISVRADAAEEAEIIGQLHKGDKVTIFKEMYGWAMTYYDGKPAWIAAHYLVPTENIVTAQKLVQNDDIGTAESKKQGENMSLHGKNIMLDAGHGGQDPGSIAVDGSLEKDMTLSLTNVIADTLRAHGATVTLVRTGDQTKSLRERVAFNKLFMTDAYISIHFNAFTKSNSKGISTHYYAENKDKQLAVAMQNALVKHTGLEDRGVLQDNYFVLRENRDTAILLELGFISNPEELRIIQSKGYSEKVANGVVEGLHHYYH